MPTLLSHEDDFLLDFFLINFSLFPSKAWKPAKPQISTSDPDSRQMIIRNNITGIAYNIQSTTDAKDYIPIDYKDTNENDSKAMGLMVRRAKVILNTNEFIALYDKRYHTGSELKTAIGAGVHVMVAMRL